MSPPPNRMIGRFAVERVFVMLARAYEFFPAGILALLLLEITIPQKKRINRTLHHSLLNLLVLTNSSHLSSICKNGKLSEVFLIYAK